MNLDVRDTQQTREEESQAVLFQLLEGTPVSQTTLDTLLTLANLRRLGKVEFFARFGPTYLPEYFKQGQPGRSKGLLGLFTTLIDADQEFQNQAFRSGQSAAFTQEWRNVILAIFWLWLRAAGDDEIVGLLFKRVKPQSTELVALLATFGSAYLNARRAELAALCQDSLKKLCAEAGLKPAEKLLLCLSLLPPESFPFMAKELPVEKALAVFQAAALTQEAPLAYLEKQQLLVDLQILLTQQEQQPGSQARILVRFLQNQGRRVDWLLERLRKFLAQDIQGVAELVKDAESFRKKQAYQKDYAASEMELFLEIQEHRVKGNYPKEIGPLPQAVYLRYLETPDKKQIELAGPFKEAYLKYLQGFSSEDFIHRQGSLELLTTLSGTGAVDKSINALANGLLTARDFLQTCQKISRRQIGYADKNEEEDRPELSSEEMRNLENALQETQQAGLLPERYQQLTDKLISAMVPCVSDLSDVLRICKLGPVLCEPKRSNPEFTLFLKLSEQASKYYRVPERQQQQPEWFAPYLEALLQLGKDFRIKKDVKPRRDEIMRALLFVQNDPDERTVLAMDAYLQRAAGGNFLKKVVALWEEYRTEPRIELILSAKKKTDLREDAETLSMPAQTLLAQPETIPLTPVSTGASISTQKHMDVEAPPFAFVSREQDLNDRRISWFDSLRTVYRMRQAIKKADRAAMQSLWETPKTYYILHLYQQQIGRALWERFHALRRLDMAYQELRMANPSRSDFQEYENIFISCVKLCRDIEKGKWTWRRASLSQEQHQKYNEILLRRQAQASSQNAGG